MKKRGKITLSERIIAVFLSLLMIIGMMPASAAAASGDAAAVITGINLTPLVKVYDGQESCAVTVTGTQDGDRISYLSGDGEWTDRVPVVKDAGTYSVSVKVEREGYEDFSSTVEAEITKADLAIRVTASDRDYDGQESEAVTVQGVKEGDTVTYRLGDGEETDRIPKISDAGEYDVAVKVHRNDNFNDFSGTCTAKIHSTDIDGLSASLYRGTYDRKEHDAVLSVDGTKPGDRVEYKLDSGDWSEQIPKVKDAGEYTVRIRVGRKNFNTTSVISLDPEKIFISKADRKIVFTEKIADTVSFHDGDTYDFSAEGGGTDAPNIIYRVENDSENDTAEISEIAEIDENGRLTLKKSGYNLKITAAAPENDNYHGASAERPLTVVNDSEDDLLSFEKSAMTYIPGTGDIVSGQPARVNHADDNGKVTYSAKFAGNPDLSHLSDLSLADAGVSLNKNSGEIEITDYSKLAAVLEANPGLKITVDAKKTAGTKKSKTQKKDTIVYAEASAAYTIQIQFDAAPDEAYRLQDPDGAELTGPNGDNGWYKTAVTVVPADADHYAISETAAASLNTFSDEVTFNNQGKAKRVIYLRNKESGGLCAPITVKELEKIDSVKPDSGRITIDFGEDFRTAISDILWFYNPEVVITLTGYDATSGIDRFSWKYTRSDGASVSNLEKDGGDVQAKAVAGKEGTYTASFKLPRNQAEQLRGSIAVDATDKAGLVSDKKADDGRVLVVDTISPARTVTYELNDPDGTQQEVDGHYYYSKPVRFTFDVTEANFFDEDIVIRVSRDGREAEQRVRWSKTGERDQMETSFVLEKAGDYVVAMSCRDRSDNEMEQYTSPVITIDLTDPVIAFSYSNGNRTAADSDDPQKAVITITEHNFRPSDIETDTSAADIRGGRVSVSDFEAYLRRDTSWKTSGDVHTAEIDSGFADAVYEMTIHYKDLARREAKEVSSGKFIVDHTAPSTSDMRVDYSTPITQTFLSVVTLGFYNPDVTITFTARDMTSGVDFFIWSYDRQYGASKTNVEKYAPAVLYASQDASDKSKFTAGVTIPKKVADQLRGNIGFTATDAYSNRSNKKTDTDHVRIVDTIAPTMTAEYTEPKRSVGSRMYYNSDFTVTFTVTEANFFSEDVAVEVSKDKGAYTEIEPSWTDRSEDVHTGTYTIGAQESHKNDGDYIFRVSYTDRSNNRMASYTSDTVVIDTVKPVISVSYSERHPRNIFKDSEGHERKYFDSVQTATVTVTEHNFYADEVNFQIDAEDIAGRKLDVNRLNRKSKWQDHGDRHMLTITCPGDANYTFAVGYTDPAANRADDYARDYFTVDKTAPDGLTVEYSRSLLDTVLSGVSFGFYQAPVTVTLSASDNISGVHRFLYSAPGASGTGSVNAGLAEQALEEESIRFSDRGARGTAVFKIPGDASGHNRQFNGTVRFAAADRAENRSAEFSDNKRIVVDNIAPGSSVVYNAPVNTDGNISYYDGSVHAAVTIEEANFCPEDVIVLVIKDGAAYNVTPVWTDSSADIHTGTFSLSDDGDYYVTINYTDKSGNKMVTYTSDQLTVDTGLADPVITINGGDGNGKAYKDDVVPAVSFEDANYSGYEIKLTRTRYDKKNEDVTEEFIGDRVVVRDKGGTGSFDTFSRERDTDGIYTLTVSVTDKAAHTAEAAVTFTVNRFGSVYVYDDYLASLIKGGGAYVRALDGDLIVTEYNPDKLVSGSPDVEVSRDGRPLDEVDFDMTPQINDRAAAGSGGWYQYRYTVDRNNFSQDGVYRMSISSRDETGNAPDTAGYENLSVLFYVDSTAPEINSITGLEKNIINAQKVNVKYSIYDTIALRSAAVYVNDKKVDEVTDFSSDPNNFEGSFSLTESPSVQNVRMVVTDKAGNVTDTAAEKFKSACAIPFNASVTVSTSIAVRSAAWIRERAAVIAGAAAAAGIFFIIIFLRRRKAI